jgi:hypothetical protein
MQLRCVAAGTLPLDLGMQSGDVQVWQVSARPRCLELPYPGQPPDRAYKF